MGKLHQPHSPPKASSPQSHWAVVSRATQLSPQPSLGCSVSARLPADILPTLAVLHPIPITGVLMEMLLTPGERM